MGTYIFPSFVLRRAEYMAFLVGIPTACNSKKHENTVTDSPVQQYLGRSEELDRAVLLEPRPKFQFSATI